MSDTLTDAELAEMRERCDRATKGPWYANQNDLIGGHCVGTIDCLSGDDIRATSVCDMASVADSGFIAHARSDIPALLDEVERVRNENKLFRAAEEVGDARLEAVEQENARLKATNRDLNRRLEYETDIERKRQ